MNKKYQCDARMFADPEMPIIRKRRQRACLAMALALGALAGCDQGGSTSRVPDPPILSDSRLNEGRSTWMQTCRACHLTGVAGAPAIGSNEAWAQRLPKGRANLHASALNGIQGPSGWTMPPRGGNPRLSDQQVRQAVDYMLAVVISRQPGVSITE